MDVKQISELYFELDDWKPALSVEMLQWLKDNNIVYETHTNRYGSASFHYHYFILFKNPEDVIAFKLRWT